jgi:hypothetical protein
MTGERFSCWRLNGQEWPDSPVVAKDWKAHRRSLHGRQRRTLAGRKDFPLSLIAAGLAGAV